MRGLWLEDRKLDLRDDVPRPEVRKRWKNAATRRPRGRPRERWVASEELPQAASSVFGTRAELGEERTTTVRGRAARTRTWRHRFGVRVHGQRQCIANVNRNPAYPIVPCTRHETSWERNFDARARDRGEAEVDRAVGGGRADGHADMGPSTHDARSFQVRVRGNSSSPQMSRRSSPSVVTTRPRILEGSERVSRTGSLAARRNLAELSTSSRLAARNCAFSTGELRFPRTFA